MIFQEISRRTPIVKVHKSCLLLECLFKKFKREMAKKFKFFSYSRQILKYLSNILGKKKENVRDILIYRTSSSANGPFAL